MSTYLRLQQISAQAKLENATKKKEAEALVWEECRAGGNREYSRIVRRMEEAAKRGQYHVELETDGHIRDSTRICLKKEGFKIEGYTQQTGFWAPLRHTIEVSWKSRKPRFAEFLAHCVWC